MAHEIAKTADGRDAFAFLGDRKEVWHGLGSEIPAGASLADIQALAGANWTAEASPLMYRTPSGDVRTWDEQRILVRSDTGDAIGMVSANRYNVVQPAEIFDFFRSEFEANKLHLDTAGVLKKGRIVFANAKLSEDFAIEVGGKDKTLPYLTLMTSYDGSTATVAYLTMLRTVCNNTLTANLYGTAKGNTQWRTTHAQKFAPGMLKGAMGLLGEALKMQADVYNSLAARTVSRDEAMAFFCDLMEINPDDLNRLDKNGKKVVSTRSENILKELAAAYVRGPGADLSTADGTAYGLLNAVTYYVDHKGQTRDTTGEGTERSRAASAMVGAGAQLKRRALEAACRLADVKLAA